MAHGGLLTLLGLGSPRQGRREEAQGPQGREGGAVAAMLKELVLDQHRTLFYTVSKKPHESFI